MNKKPQSKFSLPETSKKPTHQFGIPEAGYFERYPEFSFKYFANNHRKYSAKCIDKVKDFHDMFDRLKAISSLKWAAVKEASQQYHFHGIEWTKSDEPHGFIQDIPATLRAYPACQFKLFKECRIIGFFNSNSIFEVVWIDRHHQVYKRK